MNTYKLATMGDAFYMIGVVNITKETECTHLLHIFEFVNSINSRKQFKAYGNCDSFVNCARTGR